jgi:hypothetical protein
MQGVLEGTHVFTHAACAVVRYVHMPPYASYLHLLVGSLC